MNVGAHLVVWCVNRNTTHYCIERCLDPFQQEYFGKTIGSGKHIWLNCARALSRDEFEPPLKLCVRLRENSGQRII